MEENKKTYSEGYVGSILEEIRGDLRAFGEKLSSVDEKLESVSQTVELLVEDMDEVKANIVDMKADIVDMKADIKEINEKLDNKSDKSIFENQEKRILKLEKFQTAKA